MAEEPLISAAQNAIMTAEPVSLMPPESFGIIGLFISVTVTCLNTSRTLKDACAQVLQANVEALEKFKNDAKDCAKDNSKNGVVVQKAVVSASDTHEKRFNSASRWLMAWKWTCRIPVILSPILSLCLVAWVSSFLYTDIRIPQKYVLTTIVMFSVVLGVSLIVQCVSWCCITRIHNTAVKEDDKLAKRIFAPIPAAPPSS